MTDFFRELSKGRPSSAQVEEQKSRANQAPNIQRAQVTANEALTHPPIGTVNGWAGSSDPPGGTWLMCDGRAVAKTTYPDLFSAIGSTWNTGGETTEQFRIPDLRGRVAVGAGQGSGLTNRTLASKFGAETHTLTTAEMPSHTHGATVEEDIHNHTGSTGGDEHFHNFQGESLISDLHVTDRDDIQELGGGPTHQPIINLGWTNNTATGSDTHSHSVTINNDTHDHDIDVDNTGGGGAHANIQPSVALNFIVRAL